MIQLTLTLKMTTTKVVEMSVTIDNSPIQFRTAFSQMIMLTLLFIVLFKETNIFFFEGFCLKSWF